MKKYKTCHTGEDQYSNFVQIQLQLQQPPSPAQQQQELIWRTVAAVASAAAPDGSSVSLSPCSAGGLLP